MRQQPMRMMGLASGMDTDFIIQQTLRMHQFKIDNQMRNKKLIEWRQQTHNGIKDEITKMRSTFLSNLGSKSMMNRNVFNATKATITGKNASAVSVTTTTGTPTGSIRIGQIESLAKGASISSGASVSQGGGGFGMNARLDSLNFLGNNNISFVNYRTTATSTDGTSVTLTDTDMAAARAALDSQDLKTTITAGDKTYEIIKTGDTTVRIGNEEDGFTNYNFATAEDGKVTFSIGTQEFTLTQNESGTIRLNDRQNLTFHQEATITKDGKDIEIRRAEGSETVTNNGRALELVGETSITINGTTITINSNDTINTMLDKVNKSGAGVTMSYNRLTDRFSIESNTINSNLSELNITGTGNILNMLQGPTAEMSNGSMARVWVNDELVERSSNSFEYRGLRIALHNTTEADDEETVVTFTRDATPALNAIKDFIESYNSIIRRLEGLLSERKSSNEVGYKPLTDEEKQGMTDKQIEEWEAIAKKGILRNDQGIQNLVSSLRASFFEQIEGAGLSPSQIGLTTGSFFDGTGGQIMINEERLRAALEEDPDRVADIFVKIDTSSGSPKGVGLLHKIDSLMMNFVNTTQSTSIRNLEDSLKRVNEQIQKMQERMFAEEDRLYRQFAAMESAMSKLQQQGDWFGAMLGG